MSIAEEERHINDILNNSKQRLRQVGDQLALFHNEKDSIDEDIFILSERANVLPNPLRSFATTSTTAAGP